MPPQQIKCKRKQTEGHHLSFRPIGFPFIKIAQSLSLSYVSTDPSKSSILSSEWSISSCALSNIMPKSPHYVWQLHVKTTLRNVVWIRYLDPNATFRVRRTQKTRVQRKYRIKKLGSQEDTDYIRALKIRGHEQGTHWWRHLPNDREHCRQLSWHAVIERHDNSKSSAIHGNQVRHHNERMQQVSAYAIRGNSCRCFEVWHGWMRNNDGFRSRPKYDSQ